MATNPWQREGDEWFERNRQALSTHLARRIDWSVQLLRLYGVQPKTVMEIGCSNGWRLELIRREYEAECFGVDVSTAAIEAGIDEYPELHLRVGGIAEPPFAGQFDMVICAYVLHCVKRDDLPAAIASIDSCVSDGGHLLLADFAPDYPCKVLWRDSADVWTYKLPSICDVFTATGLYRQVAHLTLDHDTQTMTSETSSGRRGFVALLKKESRYKEAAHGG